MTAPKSVDPAGFLREQVDSASPDLLRAMVKTFADALMSAEADAICGAPYGRRSEERVNSRNGYRTREWDTRAGTVELAIPKLRSGSYFPDWLLQHRRRAEQALVSVVATSYLLGVSTGRVEKLVEQLGVASLSKAQVVGLRNRAVTVEDPLLHSDAPGDVRNVEALEAVFAAVRQCAQHLELQLVGIPPPPWHPDLRVVAIALPLPDLGPGGGTPPGDVQALATVEIDEYVAGLFLHGDETRTHLHEHWPPLLIRRAVAWPLHDRSAVGSRVRVDIEAQTVGGT
jgi:hypothetical protein